MHQADFENELNKRVARIRELDSTTNMQNAQAQGAALSGAPYTHRPSLKEQSEKSFHHHIEQADKHQKAAQFLGSHPEFDEFIQLIRSGAIQL